MDIIGNKEIGHNFNGFFAVLDTDVVQPASKNHYQIRKSSLVFLKTTFTLRERLMPEK